MTVPTVQSPWILARFAQAAIATFAVVEPFRAMALRDFQSHPSPATLHTSGQPVRAVRRGRGRGARGGTGPGPVTTPARQLTHRPVAGRAGCHLYLRGRSHPHALRLRRMATGRPHHRPPRPAPGPHHRPRLRAGHRPAPRNPRRRRLPETFSTLPARPDPTG